jgi:hypothetical protein
MEKIQVSENHRFLISESGLPFFWLGDTAWELFHRLNLKEIKEYFQDRSDKGFNLIQAVILAEVDGLSVPNTYNHLPLFDNNPDKPNEAYFDFIQTVIQMASEFGLYIGLLPTWGDKVAHLWGSGPVIFNPQNARSYGFFLGHRYQNFNNIIWILGGDRPAITQEHNYLPVWSAMSEGIDEGCGYKPIKTYHPMGGYSSSEWLSTENWLDFNMIQSGHGGGRDVSVWKMIEEDYKLIPARPTLDGEPNYEDHPVSPWPTWDPSNGYFTDYDVRKQLYRSIFAGGCGVTYGHHSIWQMITPRRAPITYPLIFDYKIAMQRPGSYQVKHLKNLILSRPYLSRIPDQSIFFTNYDEASNYQLATRDLDSSYLMVYTPSQKPISITMSRISGQAAQAWWYKPKDGTTRTIGIFPTEGIAHFNPPSDELDWVLVLDDVNKNYPIPKSI